MQYQNFDLSFHSAAEGYQVHAKSQVGEAEGRVILPFSEVELENFILRIAGGGAVMRRVESLQQQNARAFGQKLFDALFDTRLRRIFDAALVNAGKSNDWLRIRLNLQETPDLANVPWEYLYDARSAYFLALSTATPIVRYLNTERPLSPLTLSLPLRILGVVSSPVDLVRLDVEAEKARVTDAFRALTGRGLGQALKIEWLDEATLPALQRRLRQEEYHIFHFIGHGAFDPSSAEGMLVLEDEEGRARMVSASQLSVMLRDETSLRLAVLNACEGARTGVQDPFAGIAPALIRAGLPACVAMQFAITDSAAAIFASEFYSALADQMPIDAAMSEARKALYASNHDTEWGTPVLYSRLEDGILFAPTARKSSPRSAAYVELDELYRQVVDLAVEEKWAEAWARWQELHERQPDYTDRLHVADLIEQQQHLESLYRQMADDVSQQRWSDALERWHQIQEIEPDYEDADGLVARAEAGRAAGEPPHPNAIDSFVNQESPRGLPAAYAPAQKGAGVDAVEQPPSGEGQNTEITTIDNARAYKQQDTDQSNAPREADARRDPLNARWQKANSQLSGDPRLQSADLGWAFGQRIGQYLTEVQDVLEADPLAPDAELKRATERLSQAEELLARWRNQRRQWIAHLDQLDKLLLSILLPSLQDIPRIQQLNEELLDLRSNVPDYSRAEEFEQKLSQLATHVRDYESLDQDQLVDLQQYISSQSLGAVPHVQQIYQALFAQLEDTVDSPQRGKNSLPPSQLLELLNNYVSLDKDIQELYGVANAMVASDQQREMFARIDDLRYEHDELLLPLTLEDFADRRADLVESVHQLRTELSASPDEAPESSAAQPSAQPDAPADSPADAATETQEEPPPADKFSTGEIFGTVLSQSLENLNRSASWLASQLNLSRSTVNRWLKGENRPRSADVVLKIADLLDFKTDAERQALMDAAGYDYPTEAQPEGQAEDPLAQTEEATRGERVADVVLPDPSPVDSPAAQEPDLSDESAATGASPSMNGAIGVTPPPGIIPQPSTSQITNLILGGSTLPAPPRQEDKLTIEVTDRDVKLVYNGAQPYVSPNLLDYARLDAPENLSRQELGTLLFEGIIHDEGSKPDFTNRPTRMGFDFALQKAVHGLRIELDIRPGTRAYGYEWETAWDRRRDAPLAVDEKTPFHRRYGATNKPKVEAKPLHFLFAIGNPKTLAPDSSDPNLRALEPLTIEAERKIIEEAMQPLLHDGLATYEILDRDHGPPVTLDLLRSKIQGDHGQPQPHVLHLLAHGGFIKLRGEANADYKLILEDESGNHAYIDGKNFRAAMFNYDLRLIVLANCQSGNLNQDRAYERGEAFRALAPQLIDKQVPAVIAMQQDMPIDAAQLFTQRFYGDLARTGRIDMALAATRHDLAYKLGLNRSAWSIPLLMMGQDDGQLFTIDKQAVQQSTRPAADELTVKPPQDLGLSAEPEKQRLARALDKQVRDFGFGDHAALLRMIQSMAAPTVMAPAAASEPEQKIITQDRPALTKLSHRVHLNPAELKAYILDPTHSGIWLPDSAYAQIASALNAGNHIILIGPPGTGKTSLAQDICAYAAQNHPVTNRRATAGAILATATADWTTFDTVGGYVPTKSGTLQFRPGLFLKAICDAHWLVIDEINRAEIDKAFGELFTLLSGQQVVLPYTVNGEPICIVPGQKVDAPGPGWIPDDATSDYHYVIHPCWRIIGTMNVYDKASLFAMSFAFMRRFAFIDVGVPDNETIFLPLIDRWLGKKGFPITPAAPAPARPAPNALTPLQRKFQDLITRDTPLMKRRELGPAIIKDMINYMADRAQFEQNESRILVEAFLLYVAPQLDGLDYDGVKEVYPWLRDTFFAGVGADAELVLTRVKQLYPHFPWHELG